MQVVSEAADWLKTSDLPKLGEFGFDGEYQAYHSKGIFDICTRKTYFT